MLDTPRLSGLAPNASLAPSVDREGVNVTLGAGALTTSPEWTICGWKLRFARLGAGQALGLDQSSGRVYVKVIAGELASPARRPFGAEREVRDTLVVQEEVLASDEGAWVTIITETEDVPGNLRSMDQLVFNGPHAELLKWFSFEERFAGVTDIFDGLAMHMAPGIHLLDEQGTEIAYLNFWTTGKGVDVSTHNHANDPAPQAPAFAETHWVFNNGTGLGAMYATSAPGAPERERFPVLRGQEHGPFFLIDDAGAPQMLENGAVAYPWHGWQGGEDGDDVEAFDFVVAFETNPDFVRV